MSSRSRPADGRRWLSLVPWTTPVAVALGIACWVMTLTDAGGAPRVVVALTFLLFGPGAVIADLLDIDDVALRLTIAFGGSVAVVTLVAVVLVYTTRLTASAAVGVVLAITGAFAIAVTARRDGNSHS